MTSPSSLPLYVEVILLPLNSRKTEKLRSFPSTFPSEISASPPRPPLTVPVSLLPSAFKFIVTVLVFPLGPCISAVHLPETSAAHRLKAARLVARNNRSAFICLLLLCKECASMESQVTHLPVKSCKEYGKQRSRGESSFISIL